MSQGVYRADERRRDDEFEGFMRSRGNRWESPSHTLRRFGPSGRRGSRSMPCRWLRGQDRAPNSREGEGLEAVGGGVAKPVFRRRAEEARPDFVGAGLERAEGGVGVEREDNRRFRVHLCVMFPDH